MEEWAIHDETGVACADRHRRFVITDVVTNMRVLSPSRRRLQAGDVFVTLWPDDDYLFGRVVDTEADAGFSTYDMNLIYVYSVRSREPELPEREELRPDRLLIPPLIINRLPWSRGYFQTIANVDLDETDLLAQHCFEDWQGKLRDEKGRPLASRSEPCGQAGLHSFRTFDDDVSRALGFEPAPDS